MKPCPIQVVVVGLLVLSIRSKSGEGVSFHQYLSTGSIRCDIEVNKADVVAQPLEKKIAAFVCEAVQSQI